MKNSRNIATIILLIVTVGFLLTLPFQNTFAGRLLGSLFGASMIGGFADWFGVKALTGKPLGIPYRTEIIPRSREKLFESLVSMVGEELLTKESVMRKLEHFSISKSLIAYLDNDGGKEDLSRLAGKIAEDMLSGVDMEEAGEYLRKLVAYNSSGIRLVPIVSDAVEWLAANLTDERFLDAAIEKTKEFILSPQFGLLLNNTLKGLSDSISGNVQKESTGKKLFFRLVMAIADQRGLTPSRLTPQLITEIIQYLDTLKNPKSSQRKGFERWLARISNDLLVNEAAQGKIEQKGRKLLEGKRSGAFLADYIYPLVRDSEYLEKSALYIEGIINKIAETFENDPGRQKALDLYIKNALARWLENNSEVIRQLVRQKLDSCSAEMLAEVVEDKAGNDLQMIRINGSIVGGLAGVIIFLLTFWL